MRSREEQVAYYRRELQAARMLSIESRSTQWLRHCRAMLLEALGWEVIDTLPAERTDSEPQ